MNNTLHVEYSCQPSYRPLVRMKTSLIHDRVLKIQLSLISQDIYDLHVAVIEIHEFQVISVHGQMPHQGIL